MKAKLSIAFEDLRGKAGTLYVTESRIGLQVKPRAAIHNPKTAAQTGTRTHFSRATHTYKSFTPEQVAAWEAYADGQTKTQPITGRVYNHAPINTFVALATKFLQVNPTGTIPTTPPTTPFYGDSLTLSIDPGIPGQLVLQSNAANSSGVKTEFLLQPLESETRRPEENGYRSYGFKAFASPAGLGLHPRRPRRQLRRRLPLRQHHNGPSHRAHPPWRLHGRSRRRHSSEEGRLALKAKQLARRRVAHGVGQDRDMEPSANEQPVLRAIVFDLDGTLADTLPVCIAAFRGTFLEHAGREFSKEEIEALFGPSEEGSIRQVVGEDWQPAMETFLSEYEGAHGSCAVPFPGVEKLLDWLEERGLKVAIVTGKGPRSAEVSLRILNLRHRFQIVEAGSIDGPAKPAAIQRVLDQWQVPPGEVAYIGDSPSDVRSARAVGVMALSAMWEPGARHAQVMAEGPDAAFTSVEELREWLAGHIA
jgi:pyrophosphatase PpaX